MIDPADESDYLLGGELRLPSLPEGLHWACLTSVAGVFQKGNELLLIVDRNDGGEWIIRSTSSGEHALVDVEHFQEQVLKLLTLSRLGLGG